VKVRGALVQMGPHKVDRAKWDWDEIARNSVLLSRQGQGRVLRKLSLDGIRKNGSSIGAVIEVVAEGLPGRTRRADLCKLDGDLARGR